MTDNFNDSSWENNRRRNCNPCHDRDRWDRCDRDDRGHWGRCDRDDRDRWGRCGCDRYRSW
ncbi:hypothetical protein [[Clostridium] scindens]|uniref:hypothetical protein n=1 Tax=Clostridium scindens (strain JCM 10418 / VPI 12708) TaxID=29347 RepID=UPI003AB930F1